MKLLAIFSLILSKVDMTNCDRHTVSTGASRTGRWHIVVCRCGKGA